MRGSTKTPDGTQTRPLVIAEFDLERIFAQTFDDGSNLSTDESVVRHIGEKGDHVED